MRILFVVPYVPNLIRVRPYNLIRGLSARGHQVTVFTLCVDERDWEDAKLLGQHCHQVQAVALSKWRSLANCLAALPSSKPLQALYCWQPELAQRLAHASLQADVVHVEHLRGAHYGLHLKSSATGARRVPVVWDSVDCITALFRQAAGRSKRVVSRWITRFELSRTERYEGWLTHQFDRVLVTSPADKDALESLPASNGSRATAISVIPNGVDLTMFDLDRAVGREPATLVMSGKMSYHANVTMTLYMARAIMPHIWARRPDTKLLIVGKDPTREVLALGENPAITVTGTVDNIHPYLQKATAAVAPITYGAGIQNKVLEAMACATPVVSTPQAVSALEAMPGRDLLVAQEPLEFAGAVLRLLSDSQRQQEIGLAGRRYVETHHQWGNVATRLEGVYNEVISAKS